MKQDTSRDLSIGHSCDGFTPGIRVRASAHGAAGTRFRQYEPGDAIWPVHPSDEKAPSVTADEPCETMVLTPAARRWLEEHEEQLALKLYRYLLAGRFEAESAASR